MNNLIPVLAGDILSRPKIGNPFVIHYGMSLGKNNRGFDEVIENSDFSGVRIISYDDFKCGTSRVSVESAVNNTERKRRVEVALKYLGKQYSLTDFNCEHFINIIKKGESHSSQVIGATLIMSFLAILSFRNLT